MIDYSLLQYAEESYGVRKPMCSPEFEAYANQLVQDYSLSIPQTSDEAAQLFFLILEDINALMDE